jgi:hypothetical protein
MGRGGENSSGLPTRFPKEHNWFSGSKYGLLAIGVNDLYFTTWKANMLANIDSLKKLGIVPIIATITPRADRLSFIAQVNTWIRTVYNGPYIEVADAISSGSTFFPGMSMSDGIHPTIAGHVEIFKQIQIEAPYLFRSDSPFTIDFLNEMTNETVSDSIQYSSLFHFSSSSIGAFLPVPVTPGGYLFFKDTTISPGIDTLSYILLAPDRPAPPVNPVVDLVAGTFDWTNNPLFPLVADYEYSIDSGATWTTCFQKPINSPGSSLVKLRVKATFTSFKSLILNLDTVTTGIALTAKKDNIIIYPNPVVNTLNILNITEQASLTIYTADGRAVKTVMLDRESNVINTDELSSGFYFITLNNKNLSKNLKFVKR